jgi:hypothetical protein
MYYMKINKNFVHQVGDQPRLYYDARSTNHQDTPTNYSFWLYKKINSIWFCHWSSRATPGTPDSMLNDSACDTIDKQDHFIWCLQNEKGRQYPK